MGEAGRPCHVSNVRMPCSGWQAQQGSSSTIHTLRPSSLRSSVRELEPYHFLEHWPPCRRAIVSLVGRHFSRTRPSVSYHLRCRATRTKHAKSGLGGSGSSSRRVGGESGY